MEDFVNKTDVSFSQLLKKNGWFSRLIFMQLIVFPVYTLIYRLWGPLAMRSASDLAHYFTLMMGLILLAGHWAIAFLLWKKRTRFTISLAIVLLWILFAWKRVLHLLLSALQLYITLQREGASDITINFRIQVLIKMAVLAVISLVLTVIWTRKLIHLRCLYSQPY